MRSRYAIILGTAGVVLLDAWLKRFALSTFPSDTSVVSPGICPLLLHRNPGLAFNIPLRFPVVLAISVILGVALLWMAWKHRAETSDVASAALTVFIGGLGNMLDRAAYGYTVDYLLFFGRSALNLSDLVIMGGIVWMLWAGKKELPIDESAKTP
mgnify:FL=1